jgi:hypothetical protein
MSSIVVLLNPARVPPAGAKKAQRDSDGRHRYPGHQLARPPCRQEVNRKEDAEHHKEDSKDTNPCSVADYPPHTPRRLRIPSAPSAH